MTKNDFMMNVIRSGEAGSMKEAEKKWKEYREENGMVRTESAIGTLSALCQEGEVSDEAFTEWLEEAGKTAQGLKSHYNQVRLMANAIHASYN